MIPFEQALQVRDVDQIKARLKISVDKFQAGCITLCLHIWKELTSDMEVISTASGIPINIASKSPITDKYQYPFNDKEDSEIENLLKKGIIRNSSQDLFYSAELISPIFLREKSNGGYCLILNLKKLNESVEYKQFKTETLATIIQLIKPNMYLAKLIIRMLTTASHIYKPHQKSLKFEHKSY